MLSHYLVLKIKYNNTELANQQVITCQKRTKGAEEIKLFQ